jgi:hypothetical protein
MKLPAFDYACPALSAFGVEPRALPLTDFIMAGRAVGSYKYLANP